MIFGTPIAGTMPSYGPGQCPRDGIWEYMTSPWEPPNSYLPPYSASQSASERPCPSPEAPPVPILVPSRPNSMVQPRPVNVFVPPAIPRPEVQPPSIPRPPVIGPSSMTPRPEMPFVLPPTVQPTSTPRPMFAPALPAAVAPAPTQAFVPAAPQPILAPALSPQVATKPTSVSIYAPSLPTINLPRGTAALAPTTSRTLVGACPAGVFVPYGTEAVMRGFGATQGPFGMTWPGFLGVMAAAIAGGIGLGFLSMRR